MDGRPAWTQTEAESALAELARSTSCLHTSRDLGELASHFERLAEQCVGANLAAFVLPDETGMYRVAAGSLRRPATVEMARRQLGLERIRDNDGLMSALRQVGASNDPRLFELPELFTDAPADAASGTCVLVPVWCAGEPVGLGLFVTHTGQPSAMLCSILCEHAGVALQRLRALEQARRLHGTDEALWVPDTASIRDALGRELSRARRYGGSVAVSFLTVDCANELRQKYGSFYTDHLLRRVGSQLRSSIRDTDTLGAAEGGYVVLQPATSRDGADLAVARLADDVGAMLASSYPELELALIAQVSYASVVSPEDGETADELLVKLLTARDWGSESLAAA